MSLGISKIIGTLQSSFINGPSLREMFDNDQLCTLKQVSLRKISKSSIFNYLFMLMEPLTSNVFIFFNRIWKVFSDLNQLLKNSKQTKKIRVTRIFSPYALTYEQKEEVLLLILKEKMICFSIFSNDYCTGDRIGFKLFLFSSKERKNLTLKLCVYVGSFDYIYAFVCYQLFSDVFPILLSYMHLQKLQILVC